MKFGRRRDAAVPVEEGQVALEAVGGACVADYLWLLVALRIKKGGVVFLLLACLGLIGCTALPGINLETAGSATLIASSENVSDLPKTTAHSRNLLISLH